MNEKKKTHPKIKTELHPRNRHRERYDFKLLIESCPALEAFVIINKYGDTSIDFFDPAAVRMLNKALLQHYYDIDYWEIPEGYLCPPVPGRANYIHHIADLLYAEDPRILKQAKNTPVTCLDIGVGSNCIYPIIGAKEYGWNFIGSEIDPIAIKAAQKIVNKNAALKGKVELRRQAKPKFRFEGIVGEDERIDLSICNPPFHMSAKAVRAQAQRKVSNLKGKRVKDPVRNFGGQNTELWCNGGEVRFVIDMIYQSQEYRRNIFWFSSLVSNYEHLEPIYKALEAVNPCLVKTIPMGQGNKVSRIVAWTFLNKRLASEWFSKSTEKK